MTASTKTTDNRPRLILTRHQSFAVVSLLSEVYDTVAGRTLRDKLAELRGGSYAIKVGLRQVALLVRACVIHLENCGGCTSDEAAGQILTDLTPAPAEVPAFNTEARTRVGKIYRHKMASTPDLIVKVRAAYPTQRDRVPYANGECADLDIISGGLTRADGVPLQLSRMTTRSYLLTPIKAPDV